MDLKFNDLRRYAIDNRSEIKMTDRGSGRVVVINTRGQARIPGDDKDFRVDDVIAAADSFEVTGASKPELFNRERLMSALTDHFKARGFARAVHDDED
jgi:hypothetical protein